MGRVLVRDHIHCITNFQRPHEPRAIQKGGSQAVVRCFQDRKCQLETEVDVCSRKLERAAALTGGLAGEKLRWADVAKRLAADYVTLTGDVLLAAGTIAYLGNVRTLVRRSFLGRKLGFETHLTA
jgi:hypothetical protein